jgi:hypothetical protein
MGSKAGNDLMPSSKPSKPLVPGATTVAIAPLGHSWPMQASKLYSNPNQQRHRRGFALLLHRLHGAVGFVESFDLLADLVGDFLLGGRALPDSGRFAFHRCLD